MFPGKCYVDTYNKQHYCLFYFTNKSPILPFYDTDQARPLLHNMAIGGSMCQAFEPPSDLTRNLEAHKRFVEATHLSFHYHRNRAMMPHHTLPTSA